MACRSSLNWRYSCAIYAAKTSTLLVCPQALSSLLPLVRSIVMKDKSAIAEISEVMGTVALADCPRNMGVARIQQNFSSAANRFPLLNCLQFPTEKVS